MGRIEKRPRSKTALSVVKLGASPYPRLSLPPALAKSTLDLSKGCEMPMLRMDVEETREGLGALRIGAYECIFWFRQPIKDA